MKKVVIALAIVGAFVGILTSGALSSNTPAPSSGSQVACGFGTCFVPSFDAVGAVNTYAGPAAGTAQFADCCAPGDKYKVIQFGPEGKITSVFTSSGTLNGDCSTGPYADQNSVSQSGGTTKVKYIAIALPGGAPAAAYLRVSASGWNQTSGSDACGF